MTAGTRLLAPAPGSAWATAPAGRAYEQLTLEHSRSPRCRPPRSGRAGISGNSWIPAGESAWTRPTRQNCWSPSLSLMRSGSPAVPYQRKQYSGRVNAGIIWLSVRHFGEGLLIEVFDTDANPPVFTDAAEDAENGRGLFIVDALSKEWSYFFSAMWRQGCLLLHRDTYAAAITHKPPARAGLDTARAGPIDRAEAG